MKKLNQQTQGRGIWTWNIVLLIIGLTFFFLAGNFYFIGMNEESVRIAIRATARVSVLCFCVAFAASAFHLWQKNSFSWWVFMNRKYWGITFAIVHLLHLLFLVILQQQFHPVFELAKSTSLFAGGVAYFFVVAMLLTSFPFFSKRISIQNWNRLHTLGGYWIWVIFTNSYWKNMIEKPENLPLGLILLLVLLLRIWKKYK